MRPPRIVNRGRIAPASPVPIIDSGRTSFSSASAVNTFDDPEPESNIPEEVGQKLQGSIQKSSIMKKVIICLSICGGIILLFGIIFGITYPLILSHTTTTAKTTATTFASTSISTRIRNTTLNPNM